MRACFNVSATDPDIEALRTLATDTAEALRLTLFRGDSSLVGLGGPTKLPLTDARRPPTFFSFCGDGSPETPGGNPTLTELRLVETDLRRPSVVESLGA